MHLRNGWKADRGNPDAIPRLIMAGADIDWFHGSDGEPLTHR
jgi:hypothetical protein